MEMEEKENTENAEMGKRKHSHDTKIVIKYYYERIRQNTGNFLKWMGLSVLTGLVVGGGGENQDRTSGRRSCSKASPGRIVPYYQRTGKMVQAGV